MTATRATATIDRGNRRNAVIGPQTKIKSLIRISQAAAMPGVSTEIRRSQFARTSYTTATGAPNCRTNRGSETLPQGADVIVTDANMQRRPNREADTR